MAVSKTKKASSASHKTRKPVESNASVASAETYTKKEGISEMRVSKKVVIITLAILIILFLLYSARSLFMVAVVNGQPISRLAVIQQLEQQGGKQVLENLIVQTLVVQEAKKKNITVSDADINKEMKKIEDSLAKQGQTLDQALATQGLTKDQLMEQIKIQKLAQKMVGPITITDKQVNDYIEQNKASIPENANMTQIKKSIKQQLEQQVLQNKFTQLIANLRKQANIIPLVNY